MTEWTNVPENGWSIPLTRSWCVATSTTRSRSQAGGMARVGADVERGLRTVAVELVGQGDGRIRVQVHARAGLVLGEDPVDQGSEGRVVGVEVPVEQVRPHPRCGLAKGLPLAGGRVDRAVGNVHDDRCRIPRRRQDLEGRRRGHHVPLDPCRPPWRSAAGTGGPGAFTGARAAAAERRPRPGRGRTGLRRRPCRTARVPTPRA